MVGTPAATAMVRGLFAHVSARGASGTSGAAVRRRQRRMESQTSGLRAGRGVRGASTATTVTGKGHPPLRVLVINGYCSKGRERLQAYGCTDAGVLYTAMLEYVTRGHPVQLSTSTIYPANDAGFQMPSIEDLGSFDAIAWTGSNLTIWHEDDPQVGLQLELARRAYLTGVPQFGSCWGMQVAARSAGLECLANSAGREQGVSRKISPTQEGSRHPLFRDAPHTPCFDALTAHSDMVSLDSALSNDGPARCSVLAGNAWTPVQAMAIQYMGGEFWGVQYHPEFDLAEAARLMQVASPLLLDQGTFQTQSDIEDYASQMLELAQDPARLDLRLRLGIDDDVLDPDLRFSVASRWLTELVYPTMKAKGSAASSSAMNTPTGAALASAAPPRYAASAPQPTFVLQQRSRTVTTQASTDRLPLSTLLRWQVDPLTECLGAIVTGPDLDSLDQQELSAIRECLLEHEVIFFRDQAHMTPASHLKLAQEFGKVQHHEAYPHVTGFSAITVLENDRDNPSLIEQWHTDMTFRACPPLGSILHGIVIPSEPNEDGDTAGDTEFFSMAAAFNALDPVLQSELTGMTAEHSFEKGFAESLAAPGGRERLKDMLEQNPPVHHPVVRTHPESGKMSLFVNRLFTSHIVGMDRAESDALLSQLYEHMEQPQFRCRFKWTEGAVVFWDNRITQHRPVNDYWPQRRKLQRITVDDRSRPVYDP